MSEADNPLVSVIIPVFNGESHIQNAINSVLEQTYQNWELIIIDDGSTDDTLKLLKDTCTKDARISFHLRASEKKGASSCRNIGLRNSKSDYIVFLDADDALLPHCLQQRVQKMIENKFDFAVFPQKVITSSKDDLVRIFNLPVTDREELIKSFINFSHPWQTSGPIWRKQFLNILGGFDEKYFRMEDPDLHLRALMASDKFSCFYELPFDTVYNLQDVQLIRSDIFLSNVASDTLRFIELNWALLHSQSNMFFDKSSIKVVFQSGFFHMLRHYLLTKYNLTHPYYISIKSFLLKNSILSFNARVRLMLIEMIFASQSILVKKLRLRGILYRLVFS